MTQDLTMRFSELATLMDCSLKYKLGYAEGLVATGSRPALARGSAFHALMEGHYLYFQAADAAGELRDLDLARKAAGAKLNEYVRTNPAEATEIDDEMIENLRWMYAGYVDAYDDDHDWDRILVVEGRRIVPLVTHLGVRVKIATTADLIVHHRIWDTVLLVDHKTMSARDASKEAHAKENQLDPQRGIYTASYSLQGPKKDRLPVFAAYHNSIRSDKLKSRAMSPEERFGRAPIYYGETELFAIWEEIKNVARDAVEIRLGRGRAKRMYSSPDPAVCKWKCQFKEVHLTSRATGRDPVQVALDYGFERAGADNAFIGTMSTS